MPNREEKCRGSAQLGGILRLKKHFQSNREDLAEISVRFVGYEFQTIE